MKLLAYTTFTKDQTLVEIEPVSVKNKIPELFIRGYNRILAKWNDKMFILELVDDQTKTEGYRVTNPDDIVYTKTQLKYHPLAHQL